MKFLNIFLFGVIGAIFSGVIFSAGIAAAPSVEAKWVLLPNDATAKVRFELQESIPDANPVKGTRDIQEFWFSITSAAGTPVLPKQIFTASSWPQLRRGTNPADADNFDKTDLKAGAGNKILFPDETFKNEMSAGKIERTPDGNLWFIFPTSAVTTEDKPLILEYSITGRFATETDTNPGSHRTEGIAVRAPKQEQKVISAPFPNYDDGWNEALNMRDSSLALTITSRAVIKSRIPFKDLTPTQKSNLLGGAAYNPRGTPKGREIIEGDYLAIRLINANEDMRVAVGMGHAWYVPVILWHRYACHLCDPSEPSFVPVDKTQLWIPGIHAQSGGIRTDLQHPETGASLSPATVQSWIDRKYSPTPWITGKMTNRADREMDKLLRKYATLFEFPKAEDFREKFGHGFKMKPESEGHYTYTWIGGTCPVCNELEVKAE
jgi:hypothetical protein